MDKKALREYKALSAEADGLASEIQRLRGLTTTRTWPDGQPRSNYAADRTAELVAQIADLVTIYEDKIKGLVERQKEIEHAINGLDSIERQVLRLRYINRLDWEDICEELCFSERQVFRIHFSALASLKDGSKWQ